MPASYRLSFTTGGLFFLEAPVIAADFLTTKDWMKTRKRIREENLLQVRTTAAATRVSKEVISRLEHLDEQELQALLEFNMPDKLSLLWVATCRRYTFIRDFATEVLRENYLRMRRQISFTDYESFYASKALWYPELDRLTTSTQRKLRQNLFRMLREAGLLSDTEIIIHTIPTDGLMSILARHGRRDLILFPTSEKEVKKWLP